MVSCLPYDNLGVAVLTHDHEFGVQMREVIKFGIIDTLLGLPPVDLNAAVQKGLVARLGQGGTPRPANASEPTVGSISSLAGEYRAPGYGSTLNFCAFIPGEQPSEAFQKMIAGKPIVNPQAPTWVPFCTQLSLLTVWFVKATSDANAPYWAAPTTGGTMIGEFSTDESDVVGFGITGGFWGHSPCAPRGKTVKDRSEVYWTRSSRGWTS
ncbi:hypothetical protein L218DRAFT_970172 [Marasmius fiardii PR-910]|nr:hypothetical protein L218DRAFT_970172 [Marasmius fiardii PR-910]